MRTKLKNHYVRVGCNTNLPSAIYGLVLNAIPTDRLLVKEQCVDIILSNKEVKEVLNSRIGAANMVEELTMLGFLKEFAGVSLEAKLNL